MSTDFICKKCNILIKWHEPASILNNKVYCEACANHFKQQTEHVEKYDKKMISLEDNEHYVAGLEQQNKRYREWLERAFKADDLEDIWNIEDE